MSRPREAGPSWRLELETRYRSLLRYHGDLIRSPSNCIWAFLALSDYIYEKVAIEYPDECGTEGKRLQVEVNKSLTDLLSAFEGIAPDAGMMPKKIRHVKVRSNF